MAIPNKLSDQEQVSGYIAKLDPLLANIVRATRDIFLNADPEIGEQIKWNHPCFYYKGEMKAFDPKEHKRVIAVFNLYKGRIMLVFPGGAKVKDDSGLLEGDYKDGRRTAMLKDMADLKAKQKPLQQVIRKWLELVDK